MSSEVIKILDDLSARFGIAIDWSAENLQPYLLDLFTRFTNYEMYTSIMWIVFALVGTILAVIFINYTFKMDDSEVMALGVTIGGLVLILMIVVMLCNVTDIIKCCTIPEMFVLSYLKRLM